MSADIFTPKLNDSKIPVPSSPSPLRRHGSLRGANSATSRYTAAPPPNHSPLKRTNSFMERGERRHVAATKPKIWQDGKSPMPQSPTRNRSLSLSLSSTRLSVPKNGTSAQVSPKTPPTSPQVPNYSRSNCHLDWDSESVTSLTSVSSCDHASVARNGTTFSGRSMKYVFHCNQHAGATGEDYLTPTQRVHRQVKKLKCLLHQAKKDLEDKDSDILKLTKEVVELRLYKAALHSPEESNSSDAVTVRENDEPSPPEDLIDGGGASNEMNNSYTDSGHFDDFANSPVKAEKCQKVDKEVTAALGEFSSPSREQSDLILEYERKIQELVKMHEEETYQMKQKHNDKVEELLQRITEINKRYWELVPELDLAKEKIKELEGQLEEACSKLEQQEERQKETYLDMYNKGHEAARVERENRLLEIASQGPSRISVPELLEELQVTKNELDKIKDLGCAPSAANNSQFLLSTKEALSLWVLGARKAMYRQLVEAKNRSKIDPEITLQFLKSAIYYFLTDKENSQGHLKAIQSILGFTSNEISNIDKARVS